MLFAGELSRTSYFEIGFGDQETVSCLLQHLEPFAQLRHLRAHLHHLLRVRVAVARWHKLDGPFEAVQRLVERLRAVVPAAADQRRFHARLWDEATDETAQRLEKPLRRAFEARGRKDAVNRPQGRARAPPPLVAAAGFAFEIIDVRTRTLFFVIKKWGWIIPPVATSSGAAVRSETQVADMMLDNLGPTEDATIMGAAQLAQHYNQAGCS